MLDPVLQGALADHPKALAFAAEIMRVHRRYAGEVVAAHHLCPFLKDVDTGFGTFCVIVDREPSIETVIAAIMRAPTPIVHVVFPLFHPAPSDFERFSAKVMSALKDAIGAGRLPLFAGGKPVSPVAATFHPALAGDASGAHRMIGLLRRAPDPFIQLIPPGMSDGGTVFAGAPLPEGAIITDEVDHAAVTFDRLKGGGITKLLTLIDAIHADRAASYAPFIEALSAG